jgi:glyoxylase-like metal-dependent hydrolase (beta-lactamase superfamily II)
MIDSTPALDDECAPVPMPQNIPRDVLCVINTHLHFDHCGGNRLFPGATRSMSSRAVRSRDSGTCSRSPLRPGSHTLTEGRKSSPTTGNLPET